MRKILILFFVFAALTSCKSSKKIVSQAISPPDKALLQEYEKKIETAINPLSLTLYKEIDAWWGTPYRLGGTSKKGIDCSGFVQIVTQKVNGIQLPRSSKEQLKATKPVKFRKLKEGDLVFFALVNKKKVSHVGIYLNNNFFVHASTSKGVRIDNLKSYYYKKNFLRGGKIKK